MNNEKATQELTYMYRENERERERNIYIHILHIVRQSNFGVWIATQEI